MEHFQLSKKINRYMNEIIGCHDIILPNDYYDEYEQITFIYRNENDEYSISAYYQADDEVFISCYINDKFIFENDVNSLEEFIECLKLNNFSELFNKS